MKLGEKKLIKVYAKHEPYYDTGHLGEVIDQMKILGAPTIKVIDWRSEFFAIEGSHRLYAAHYLGLVPNFEIEISDRFDPSDEGFWDSVKKNLPHYAWLI